MDTYNEMTAAKKSQTETLISTKLVNDLSIMNDVC